MTFRLSGKVKAILIISLLLSIKLILLDYDYIDVLVSRILQINFEDQIYRAKFFSSMLKFPVLSVILLLASFLAYIRWGRTKILLSISAYFVSSSIVYLLSSIIFVSRPDSELIFVDFFSLKTGWPSHFCLVMGSIYGMFLFKFENQNDRNKLAIVISQIIAFLIILLAVLSRTLLGAHWISQSFSSALLGIVLSVIIFKLCQLPKI